MLKYFFYSNWKQFQVFKIAKFEFNVTVHCSLWTKCTQLWPLASQQVWTGHADVKPGTGQVYCPPGADIWIKGSRMGHSVKFSLWCVTLLINTIFRFFVSPELSSGRDLVIQMSARRPPSAVRRPWFFVRSISREPYDLPWWYLVCGWG